MWAMSYGSSMIAFPMVYYDMSVNTVYRQVIYRWKAKTFSYKARYLHRSLNLLYLNDPKLIL